MLTRLALARRAGLPPPLQEPHPPAGPMPSPPSPTTGTSSMSSGSWSSVSFTSACWHDDERSYFHGTLEPALPGVVDRAGCHRWLHAHGPPAPPVAATDRIFRNVSRRVPDRAGIAVSCAGRPISFQRAHGAAPPPPAHRAAVRHARLAVAGTSQDSTPIAATPASPRGHLRLDRGRRSH